MEDYEAQEVEFWAKLEEEGMSRSSMLRRSAAAAFGLTVFSSAGTALGMSRSAFAPPLKGTAAGLPEGQSGVLVEAVREGGWAALGHLADGDVILSIDGDVLADVATVQQKMERVAKEKPAALVMKVRRGIRTFFVELQTGWQPAPSR